MTPPPPPNTILEKSPSSGKSSSEMSQKIISIHNFYEDIEDNDLCCLYK